MMFESGLFSMLLAFQSVVVRKQQQPVFKFVVGKKMWDIEHPVAHKNLNRTRCAPPTPPLITYTSAHPMQFTLVRKRNALYVVIA